MKKIVYLTLMSVCLFNQSFSQNWLPLEVGNKWAYFQSSEYYYAPFSGIHVNSLLFINVQDSLIINNKKYFTINEFLGFPYNTIVSYDSLNSQIIIHLNDSDYVFMDFTLPDETIFSQIQPDGSFLNAVVKSINYSILGNPVVVKGFVKEIINPRHKTCRQYFYPSIGFVRQDEGPGWTMIFWTDNDLIEYLIHSQAGTIHVKHDYEANIQFEPVLLLADSIILKQNFKIIHPLSVLSEGILSGVSYINRAILESYYSRDTTVILNQPKVIYPLSEIDFALEFEIDTNLYNEGYHLHYRIIAEDKGIIPVKYYNPVNDFYKLYWKDSSTTSIELIEKGPVVLSVSQNYPNPFNPITSIQYAISSRQFVTLKVYDVLGKEIATLVNEEKSSGSYETEFNAAHLASGIYYYLLRAGGFVETKKMILIK